MPLNSKGNDYEIVPRVRHDRFIKRFLAELSTPGTAYNDALLRAAKETWSDHGCPRKGRVVPRPDRYFMRMAKRVLANPENVNAIARYLEQSTGITVGQLMEWHVKFIKGDWDVEKVQVLQDGTVVRVQTKLPPDPKMLLELEKLTIPQPAQRVEIDQRSVIMSQITEKADDQSIPEMTPRRLPIDQPTLPSPGKKGGA